MKLNSVLNKDGIESVIPIDSITINSIVQNIADILCTKFSEHNLDKNTLVNSLSKLNMFFAKMPNDLSGAKYSYENNSIYFSQNTNLSEMTHNAIHECLHYIQELRNEKGKLVRLGLSSFKGSKTTGLALNEAAVQYITSIANESEIDVVKYYDINMPTPSPDYYPMECAIIRQMSYFTGDYPLIHSTLYSDDIFKNSFIAKSDEATFYTIQNNLDLMLKLESTLTLMTNDLSCSSMSLSKINKINKAISLKKLEIAELFLNTQNLIMEKCFGKEFESVCTLEDLSEFKTRLYDFKNYIGVNDTYTFYNNFYRVYMTNYEEKKEYIKLNGPIFDANLSSSTDLMLSKPQNIISFFKKILLKVGILVYDV